MLKKIDKWVSYAENAMLVIGMLSTTFILFSFVSALNLALSGLMSTPTMPSSGSSAVAAVPVSVPMPI